MDDKKETLVQESLEPQPPLESQLPQQQSVSIFDTLEKHLAPESYLKHRL